MTKTEKRFTNGDILKIDCDTAVVEYSKEYTGFILKPIEDYYFDNNALGVAINYMEVEVIGNIYDNKDLLEGE